MYRTDIIYIISIFSNLFMVANSNNKIFWCKKAYYNIHIIQNIAYPYQIQNLFI
jgi:hypothetical protein